MDNKSVTKDNQHVKWVKTDTRSSINYKSHTFRRNK